MSLFFLFVSEFCIKLFLLITTMRTRAQVSAADIRLHAAKKRAVTDAGSSRPSRKSRIDSQSISAREPDVSSVTVLEPIIALSAPTMLPPIEVPSVGVGTTRDEDAAAEPLAAPAIGVQAESGVAVESEHSAAAPTVSPWERSRVQSSTDFMEVSSARPSTGDQRKVPATSTDDGSSAGLPTLFDIRIPAGESVLANPSLARRLIEAALLLTDRKNRRNRTVSKSHPQECLLHRRCLPPQGVALLPRRCPYTSPPPRPRQLPPRCVCALRAVGDKMPGQDPESPRQAAEVPGRPGTPLVPS